MTGPGIDALDVVLGEVSIADEAEVVRRLRDDPEFRAEVERLAPLVARLQRQPRETWTAPEPPALVVGAPVTARRRRRLRALVLRPAMAIACALALLAGGIGGGLLLSGGDAGDDAKRAQVRRVVLAPLGSGTARARAVVVQQAGGRVRIEAAGLQPDGRSHHELWLIPAAGKGDPVAIGTFQVGADGRAAGSFRLPDDPARYALFDVSEEPADGNPGHSGRSVLRAPVSRS
jgi:anti-sigma-K factor RskA